MQEPAAIPPFELQTGTVHGCFVQSTDRRVAAFAPLSVPAGTPTVPSDIGTSTCAEVFNSEASDLYQVWTLH
jgi:hypothetical protein